MLHNPHNIDQLLQLLLVKIIGFGLKGVETHSSVKTEVMLFTLQAIVNSIDS